MAPQLSYVMVFVSDMDRSVAFYRDTLGFTLRFTSSHWTEFSTGQTILALHPGTGTATPSERPRAGTAELGIVVPNLDDFYRDMQAKGVKFSLPPTRQDYGGRLAKILDPDGATISVAEPFEEGQH